MSKVLIIDGGAKWHGTGGTLTHSFVELATDVLNSFGHQVTVTTVDREFSVDEEVEKIIDADSIILQFPAWWMNPPWQVKRYQDEVFLDPRINGGDGRTRSDATQLYGRGGVCVSKTYMLSSTWNAPKEAFDDPLQFFEGKGIDAVLMSVHKTFQFLSMRPLPSFMANDVLKNPQIAEDMQRFKEHLNRYFGASHHC